MLQPILHYGIHFIVPIAIAYIFYRPHFIKVTLILFATMLVDVDHLLATPIFDPNRCSINFHVLHKPIAIAGYVTMLFFTKTRVLAIGLVLHMLADFIDCQFIAIT